MSFPAKDSGVQERQLDVQELVFSCAFTQAAASTGVGIVCDLAEKVGIRCEDSTQNSIATIAESGEDIANGSTDYVNTSVANTAAILHFLINLGDDTAKKVHSVVALNRATNVILGTVLMCDLSKGISNKGNIKFQFNSGLDLVDAAAAVTNVCFIVKYQVV